VTRLGDISPYRRVFTLASFLKITEVAHIVGLLFSRSRLCFNFWQERGWATFFFTYSSGHPDHNYEPTIIQSIYNSAIPSLYNFIIFQFRSITEQAPALVVFVFCVEDY
jgi:hypothetical protein